MDQRQNESVASMMKAKKVFNNNVVLAEIVAGEEVVLVGNGVGFNVRKGDPINRSKIDKQFVLKQAVSSKFINLIKDIPLEQIAICEEVITYIKEENSKILDETFYVTLTDHLINMIQRIKQGIDFDTFLLLNVKSLYPEEYQLAVKALEILRERTQLRIDDSEASFIALHIVNAEGESNMMETYTVIEMINGIAALVTDAFSEIDQMSLAYNRFLIHCRFFVQRFVKSEGKAVEVTKEHSLYQLLKQQYPKQQQCLKAIEAYLQKKDDYLLNISEKTYLLMHLVRLTEPHGS